MTGMALGRSPTRRHKPSCIRRVALLECPPRFGECGPHGVAPGRVKIECQSDGICRRTTQVSIFGTPVCTHDCGTCLRNKCSVQETHFHHLCWNCEQALIGGTDGAAAPAGCDNRCQGCLYHICCRRGWHIGASGMVPLLFILAPLGAGTLIQWEVGPGQLLDAITHETLVHVRCDCWLCLSGVAECWFLQRVQWMNG